MPLCAYRERFKLLQILPENVSCSIRVLINQEIQIVDGTHERKFDLSIHVVKQSSNIGYGFRLVQR